MAREASLRQYIGAAQVYPSLILQQISWTLFAAFCLFVRTLPIDFALLKSKTTAKLTEKRTSLASVRDILWMFGTFPTPLLSRSRLPLKGQCHEIFDFCFFSWISFPQAPEYTIMVVSNFFENLRRYSQLKVCHRCQQHLWQMQKIFNYKSLNYLVWTPLGSIVNL